MLRHLVTGGRSSAVSSKLSTFSCFSDLIWRRPHLQVGDSAEISKTFTQNDVKLFLELKGDTNPLHLDENFAKNTRFGKPVIHGVLLNGLVSAVLGTKLPGYGCVLLSQDIRFPAPLHAGEEVVARAQEKALKKSLAFISVSCVATDGGRTVMEGAVKVLIPGLPTMMSTGTGTSQISKGKAHDSATAIVREVIQFWAKARIPTRQEYNIVVKLKDLHGKWQGFKKNSGRKTDSQKHKEEEFTDILDNLFYIAHADAMSMINIEEDRMFLEAQREKGRRSMGPIDTKLTKKKRNGADSETRCKS
ncbi:uncharacterized protein LOC142255034 [Anomaloglossus baeobatrachus]|uniref:uncharacterized protein LOC142255034 n=1 Tax=Anomaloglossus baeobatrachus TaxID=238106 RepID=UPI003F50BB87